MRRLRASLCRIYRYTHCCLTLRAAVALYSCCNTRLLQHTHTSRVWTCPRVRNLQFAPCWKKNMLTRRYILLPPQKLEAFPACILHIKAYLRCLASNTEISKIAVGFNCISLGSLLLFVNMWKLDLFFVCFLKCFGFFYSDIPAFLSCFFLVHFGFSLTNKEILNAICSVDDLLELKCRRKIWKSCQNWNVFQDFCKKMLVKIFLLSLLSVWRHCREFQQKT